MFRAIVFAAAIAGIAAGTAVSLIQAFTTTPLILAAEQYEHKTATAAPQPLADHAHNTAIVDSWKPSEGVERLAYTALSNLMTGIGFGLLLTGGIALAGRPVDGRAGLLWGAAGFTAFALAPALGLPPELPGMASPDLAARQLWWLFAVAGAAAGLAVLVFGRGILIRLVGVFVMGLPHVIGAPHAQRLSATVPPELAAQFATASIVTAAVFWAVLGWLAGMLFGRFRGSGGAPNF